MKCCLCNKNPPQLKRPKTLENICKECFFKAFEEEIHETIVKNKLFSPGDKVAIGISGGKDSTVLAYVIWTLNKRHNYGIELFLLSIDEGIKGYRDDSLETVKRNAVLFNLPLKIVGFKALFGYTMDEIVTQVGMGNSCTFCGVFRRKALDYGCQELGGIKKMLTGHNADDFAETVLMNLLRGDSHRMKRCLAIETHDEGGGEVPRAKPFKYTYEKEIVLYAFYKKLEYFTTECTYAPESYRGYARELIKDMERINPQTIINIIKSAETFAYDEQKISKQTLGKCERCGYLSSQKICRSCTFAEALNKGTAKLSLFMDEEGKIKQNKIKKFGLQDQIQMQQQQL